MLTSPIAPGSTGAATFTPPAACSRSPKLPLPVVWQHAGQTPASISTNTRGRSACGTGCTRSRTLAMCDS